MPNRPLTVAAGALLGMSALFLASVPTTAVAAEQEADATTESPRVTAHRGASGYAPENTLAAVDKAAELGVQWVENDVQRTRDGELIVMHDTTLDRTTNAEQVYPDRAPWHVSDFTAEEISRLDAGSWFGEEFAGARVPTLERYLDRISAYGQNLLLELKSPQEYPGIEAETLKELSNEGWLDRTHLRDRLVVQSFEADSVRTVHDLEPDVRTGFLGTPDTDELASYARFADQINPAHADVTEDYVDAVHAVSGAHDEPLQVHTWTVDEASEARRVTKAGVDGVISNVPDVVRDAARD